MLRVLEDEINLTGFGLTLEADKDNLYSKKSKFQKVDVFKSKTLGTVLTLDGLMMATTRDEFFYHEMIVHIPMLSHKNPESVLVIGGGDGGTVREVLLHDTVKTVDLCEIDGDVIEVSKKFMPSLASGLDNPKVKIYVEDAIEFIKDKKNKYDVVLIDSTDPMGPGEGLFTEEFYTNVKESLKEGGIVVPQSESPFANPVEMKKMYLLLNKVFKTVLPYAGPIPTYPGGYWSWAFCSDDNNNLIKDMTRARQIEKNAKLYNTDLHGAVFCVPNFVKENLKNE